MVNSAPQAEKSKYSSVLIQLEDTKELAGQVRQKFDMQTTPELIWADIVNIKSTHLPSIKERNELINLHQEVVKLYRIADKLYCGSSFYGLSKERQQLLKNCIIELKNLKSMLFQVCQNSKANEDQSEQ